MVKFYSIFFIFLVTAQLGIKLVVISYWSINQKMIAAELCINKDNEESDCCGKCYLNTQLEKTESSQQKDESKPESKLRILELDPTLLINNVLDYADKRILIEIDHSEINTSSYYKFHFSQTCYHPPESLV